MRRVLGAAAAAAALLGCAAAQAPRTMAEILADAPAEHWRDIPPERLVTLTLPGGAVVIELAPDFAPAHVANIKTLVREGYFDGLTINRVHDNYVVQWGDPADPPAKPLGSAKASLAPEFDRALTVDRFTPLPDGDVYAREVGFRDGFPVARDPASGREWLAHCYGMVGVARDADPASGSGAQLYVVIGHAPRNLDRNVTLAGRVISGMPLLAGLKRGTEGPLGLYATAAERVPIGMRLGAEGRWQSLRPESVTFAAVLESRRNRREAWYARPAGAIDLCNAPLPVRLKP